MKRCKSIKAEMDRICNLFCDEYEHCPIFHECMYISKVGNAIEGISCHNAKIGDE